MQFGDFGLDEDVINQIKENAVMTVKSIFDTPEQLEKLDIFLEKEIKNLKKKEQHVNELILEHSGELNKAMREISMALTEISCLRDSADEMVNLSQGYKKSERKLEKLIACAHEASSTTQTLNLLRHIINMSDTLETTKKLMMEQQLLQVHKSLRDLEDVRDKILAKHFDTSNSTTIAKSVEKNLLLKNFEPIRALSEQLLERVRAVLRQLITYMEHEPVMLVSILRIIEREELVDRYWECEAKKTSFQQYVPADRPKKWASNVDVFLAEFVNDRVNVIKSHNMENGVLKFPDFVFRLRDAIIDDLKKVHVYGVRCFPPSYSILVRFSAIFHNAMIEVFKNAVDSWNNAGVEKDIISVIIFNKEYLGPEFFGNPQFNPEIVNHLRTRPPLVESRTLQQLEHSYLAVVFDTLNETVHRIVNIEKRMMDVDETPPEVNRQYITFTSSFYRDFVGIRIGNVGQLSASAYAGVFKHCVFAFEQLVSQYEIVFENYVSLQFGLDKNSSASKSGGGLMSNLFRLAETPTTSQRKFENFVEHCICVANNCHAILEAALLMKKEIISVLSPVKISEERQTSLDLVSDEFTNRINNINTLVEDFGHKCILTIVNEYMYDLRNSFDEFLSAKWKEVPHAWSAGLENCLTNFNDILSKLYPAFLPHVMERLDKNMAQAYLTRFLNYKAKYSSEQSELFGGHILHDANFLAAFFQKYRGIALEESYCYTIVQCASVFKNTRTDSALIDLAKMFKVYSDFSREHGFALISKRADLTKDKIQETLNGILDNRRLASDCKSGIFSLVRISN